MSSSPSNAQIDPADLQRIAEIVDNEDFVGGHQTQPHLELLPVSPGRFHAHWRVEPAQIDAGRQILGVEPDAARLVLRAYEFNGGDRNYAHARTEDFAVHGLDSNAYFDLNGTPEFIGGVLGLVNSHGHFRPIMRSETVALPQNAAPPPPKSAAAVAQSTPRTGLDEQEVLSRLPQLIGLPAELMKAPEDLVLYKRAEDARSEATAVTLTPTPALDESAVHAAVITGACKVLPEAAEDAPTIPAPSSPVESTGASELLASQWSDAWDDFAPIHLRAEISVSGRLGPGLKLSLGGKEIRPLPGGYFKIVRKLNAFAEAWPLFSTLSLLEEPNKESAQALYDASGQAMLEIQASVFLEGRINDPDYLKFLPEGVTTDSTGRFSINRALPNGAVLLPGLSLLANG